MQLAKCAKRLLLVLDSVHTANEAAARSGQPLNSASTRTACSALKVRPEGTHENSNWGGGEPSTGEQGVCCDRCVPCAFSK